MGFSLNLDELIDNRFKIHSFLAQGTYGKVFEAADEYGNNYAVKFRINKNGLTGASPQEEGQIIQQIRTKSPDDICIPQVVHFGEHQDQGVLVIKMLGEDLNDLQDIAANQLFKFKTVFQIGYQVVDILQHIHKAGFIHKDVYPGNLVIGAESDSDHIHLIDFGSAVPVKFKEGDQCCVGTDLNLLYEDHPVADLEQLGYTMIGLAKHNFSWEETLDRSVVNATGITGTRSRKFRQKICKGVPDMEKYFSFIDRLGPSTYPDYDGLKRVISDILFKRWDSSAEEPLDWDGPKTRSEGNV